MSLDLDRPVRWGTVALGLSYDDQRVRERADVVVGAAPATSSTSMRGKAFGGYGEATRNFAGATVRAGLRADAFEGHGTLELSPRASLLVPLSETALFRLAAGRFTQLSRRSDPAVESELGIQTPGFQDKPLLAVATGSHLVASLDQRISPLVTVGLEGFVKSFSGLPEAEGDRVNASGMDLRIAREAGSARGWLGYTLTWFWSDAGSLTNARFSGHHLLTAGASGPLGRVLEGAVRLSYGSGLPFSSVPFGDAVSAPGMEDASAQETRATVPIPEESFLRVDVTFSGRWTVGGNPERSWTISPYVRILNALDRRDSLFFYFEPWRADSPRPLAEMPVLPLVGVRIGF